MARVEDSLHWSAQLAVTPPLRTPKLPGDKIILPQSALEQLLAAAPITEVSTQESRSYTRAFDPFNPHTFAAESRAREQGLQRQQQLPHPLTFRIVNPQNDRVIYAGIREFSASENEVGLSASLRDALGFEDDQFRLQAERNLRETQNGDGDETERVESIALTTSNQGPTVTVHAKQLPKGTYVRLRPLEAGYDPEDWKALLERYLRDNFTTLTTGEILTVLEGRNESFRFLVDKVYPEGDGICIVDTDLEVDILALSEEQARETLRRRLEKAARAPGTKEGSSIGGVITIGEGIRAQVAPGEYVDYELHNWDHGNTIQVELDTPVDITDVFLFVSPLSSRQRNRPREDEHIFGDFSSRPSKQIRIQPTNVELEGAEALYISTHISYPQGDEAKRPVHYNLRVVETPSEPREVDSEDHLDSHDPEDVQCKNCQQWVPQRTLILHENFCLRNNVFCPDCHNVFQKRSPEWQNHWHCPHDSSYGNDAASKHQHDSIFHKMYTCPICDSEAKGLPSLAQHRTTTCPGKSILCQFCHLVVPQQGESDPDIHDPEVLLSGLTPHELVDGGRTTECHLCSKIIRLRDMKTHLRHHDLERLSRPPPRVCLNQNCGRTIGQGTANNTGNDTLGLCSICYGPLYVDTYDPEGKALRRRIERRYLSQMMTGCGKSWCQNKYCKTGKQLDPQQPQSQPASLSATTILTTVRPLLDAVNLHGPNIGPLYLCTDQAGQQRRGLAEMIAAEGAAETGSAKIYDLAWCVAAVEATGGDLTKAREWLENWAPARGENAGA
ncbi:hypothetical protein ASPWEDRAFT_174556 [Aspergillus wentii DTO 134E9]|uniref:Uncharacterized protein n=1 Tax=Aspergillus wentii DTO 134E9 TaxID=1073089 RepID=A0A1L9RDY2_ASPWE|nr:uncharacterized protein ASPWEDRAFT_174556 [Aspergillus wentii DTO 134E9]KAI9933395.1 hypothetical protein MW887_007868 [Aspergillus wentii]OJJ33131.1 hypothetical protein ASPWEDRAFT_174556 [Aspergillus wentii DTO 134E9]